MSATSPVRNPWLEPLARTAPPSLSERLIRALEAHLAAESHDVGEYQQLVRQSTDPVAQLVLGMILEDAEHHLGLLQRMIRRLQEEVEFTPSLTALPVPAATPEPADGEAAASLRALIRNAHEGSRYLRHLSRQEPGLYHGLYAALFETLARDGEKHATLLHYLLRGVERQPTP
jgi:hypothetical protein